MVYWKFFLNDDNITDNMIIKYPSNQCHLFVLQVLLPGFNCPRIPGLAQRTCLAASVAVHDRSSGGGDSIRWWIPYWPSFPGTLTPATTDMEGIQPQGRSPTHLRLLAVHHHRGAHTILQPRDHRTSWSHGGDNHCARGAQRWQKCESSQQISAWSVLCMSYQSLSQWLKIWHR